MIVSNRLLNVRGLAASPNCEGCPCARNGQPYRPVRAFGSPGGLCIVGEGPGENELLQGYPFVGASGKVVTQGLIQASTDRALTWITNAILCKRPADDQWAAIAVEHCRPRLQADLATGRPTAICALGGTAMRALRLPVHFVSEARGTVQYSPLLPSVPVIGSIHPAAILRGGAGEMKAGGKQKMSVDAQAMFLFSDMIKAARVADGSLSPAWSDDIMIIHEAGDVAGAVAAILNDIYADGLLGLDLEWVCEGSKNPLDALGADAHRAIITWVGIGCTTRAVSFKWEALVEDFQARGSESGLIMLQAAMESEHLPKIIQNKQADRAIWEAQVGPINPQPLDPALLQDPNCVAGRVLDTMLMHHCSYPGIDHDLQQVASQFLCVPTWKVDHARDVAEYRREVREGTKREKSVERERKKAERIAAHEKRNADRAAEKAARKAAKVAGREAANTAVMKMPKRQLRLRGVDEGTIAETVAGDIVDPPEPYEIEREDGDSYDV